MILGLVLVVGLFLLIGYITGRAQDRFLFLKAGTYFLLMELTSSFALLLSVVIGYLLIVKGSHYQIDIFNFGIIVTLIGAIFNFYIVKFLGLFHKANSLLIMQVEYYIQWATLFLTLYQFLTGSKTNMKTVISSGLSNQTVDINILNLAVLPLLLVSWISIAMIKIYLTDHKSTK